MISSKQAFAWVAPVTMSLDLVASHLAGHGSAEFDTSEQIGAAICFSRHARVAETAEARRASPFGRTAL